MKIQLFASRPLPNLRLFLNINVFSRKAKYVNCKSNRHLIFKYKMKVSEILTIFTFEEQVGPLSFYDSDNGNTYNCSLAVPFLIFFNR